MTMNKREMNNYSLMRISTVFVLTIALVVSTFTIPLMPRTGAELLQNNPPDDPKNPDPADGSTDIPISTVLTWEGGDPDGDPVTYDVYFGTTSPPVQVESNLTNATYTPPTLVFATQYFWQIVAWDNQSASTIGPEWQFRTEENKPPEDPKNPEPANGAVDVPRTATLSWIGGDPNIGDSVTYDVYFGTSSVPPKLTSNISLASYSPTMAFGTLYYWKIIAWDSEDVSTEGPLWYFTTVEAGPLTVTITKPLPNKLYFMDQEKMDLNGNTIVYGKITITAEVNSSAEVTNVKFYADGKPIGEDNSTPYECFWQPIIQFNGLSLKRNITVIAYDSDGNNASAQINITKWRFHILPWVLAGMAIASRLVLHTTVVGTFFNVQQTRFSCSFYVIRAHYKTVGPFQMRRGTIHFKHVTGGMIIGPQTMTKMGPFHRFAIGSFSYIGGMNAERLGFGGALLSGFSSRTTGGRLLNLYRNLKS